MALLIFMAFVAIPIIEIALFITLGQSIGLMPTLVLVVLTAFLGTALLRIQGMAAVSRARAHLQAHEMPVEEVFVGVFLLVAGALLLTPGFLTDALGFLLFVPAVRRRLGRAVFNHLLKQAKPAASRSPRGPTIIEGDFEDLDPPRP